MRSQMFYTKNHNPFVWCAVGIIVLSFCYCSPADNRVNQQDRYDKTEYMIPMRDGVKLFTQVNTPKDTLYRADVHRSHLKLRILQ